MTLVSALLLLGAYACLLLELGLSQRLFALHTPPPKKDYAALIAPPAADHAALMEPQSPVNLISLRQKCSLLLRHPKPECTGS